MAYQLDETREIQSQDLSGETVILSETDCRGLRDCTFASGTLRLAQHSKKWPIMIVRTSVMDSEIVAAKAQKDDRLFKARFINCRFHGVFSGIDFGRGDRDDLGEDFGTVEGCDFTDAILDGCRFLDVDVSTLIFPQENHAVLLDPYRRTADVAAMQWPGVLGKYMEVCTNKPESFKASVMHIPSLARLVKCSEDEIKGALQEFGGVVM